MKRKKNEKNVPDFEKKNYLWSLDQKVPPKTKQEQQKKTANRFL